MATRIKQLSSKYTDILTRFRMLQSFDSCYIWRLLFCFVLQALSPVMTTLKTLKCSSNWPKCLFVTQSIHFGNHNLEIHSDVSEFTGPESQNQMLNEIFWTIWFDEKMRLTYLENSLEMLAHKDCKRATQKIPHQLCQIMTYRSSIIYLCRSLTSFDC